MVLVRSVQVDQHPQKTALHARVARLTKSLSTESALASKDSPTMKEMSA